MYDVRSASRSQDFFAILDDYRKESVPVEAVDGSIVGQHPLESAGSKNGVSALPPKSAQPDNVDF